MRENKFFAWLQPIEPSAGWPRESVFALESELQDNEDEEDNISLSVDITGEVVEITVYQ
jgi:hypothetical protein